MAESLVPITVDGEDVFVPDTFVTFSFKPPTENRVGIEAHIMQIIIASLAANSDGTISHAQIREAICQKGPNSTLITYFMQILNRMNCLTISPKGVDVDLFLQDRRSNGIPPACNGCPAITGRNAPGCLIHQEMIKARNAARESCITPAVVEAARFSLMLRSAKERKETRSRRTERLYNL